jgi:hypothetical protein
MVQRNIQSQQDKWERVLAGILRVILFMAERGMAFRGTTEHIGDRTNGNFLGLIELCSTFDDLLKLFVEKVKLICDIDRYLNFMIL